MADFEKKQGEIVRADQEEPTVTMYGVVDEKKITDQAKKEADSPKKNNAFVSSVIHLGATLGLISLIIGGLLAGVNALTADRIKALALEKKANAMESVQPQAEEFSPVEREKTPLVAEVQKAIAGGQTVGYAVTATPVGFGGTIELIIGVDLEGKVTGVSVVSMTETAGLGTRAGEEAFKGQYVNKTAPIRVVKTGAGENEINAISGATITSEAVTKGVNAALEAVAELS